MKNLWAFDTEDNSKGKAFLFNFYDVTNEKHHTFKSQAKALDFVCNLKKCTLWACNLEYDIINLFRDFYGLLHYSYAGSRLISCELKDDKILFLNTFNHWPMSVKKMGERINLPKFEMEHKGESKVTKQVVEYCRRDTEIVGRFVQTMYGTYESIGCRVKSTVASTTLDFFEKSFYPRVTHPFQRDEIDWFHSGYYGGRTEIFFNRPVTGKIHYSDVNSLYPYCLKKYEFPELYDSYEPKTPDFKTAGISELSLYCPQSMDIPYLPNRTTGKLLFPTGYIHGVYTHFEINEAIKLGYRVEHVDRTTQFTGVCRPFTEYVDTIYKKRLEAQESKDDLMQMSYKSLMNNLYGKFAQKNEITSLVPLSHRNMPLPGDVIFGDLVLRKTLGEYPRHANCVWSMYTTAFARHLLYRALIRVTKAGGLLLYCDTDSVVYESSKPILEDSRKLGKFKLEGLYQYAHFKLPKLYCLRGSNVEIYKSKGVPQIAAKEYFNAGRAQYRKPIKLRESLRRNLSPKRKHKLVANYWISTDKEISGKYDKRVVLNTGHTKPIYLDGITKKDESNVKRRKSSSTQENLSSDCKTQ